jgi:hypothetical protein
MEESQDKEIRLINKLGLEDEVDKKGRSRNGIRMC